MGHCSRSLPDTVAGAVDAVAQKRAYAAGEVLFLEECPPRRVFILCSGRVRLSVTARNGNSCVLKIADQPGEFLGVSAVISGEPYPFMAKAVDTAQISFIERRDFLRLIHAHPELAVSVVTQLSDAFSTAYWQMRLLLREPVVKLAALLLESAGRSNTEGKEPPLTHEAISQTIGISRENVSRVLADWRRNGWITTQPKLMIINRAALEQLADRAMH